jgi:transposase
LAGEGTYEDVAVRFRVGTASVSRWLRAFRQTGSIRPKPHGGGMPPKIDAECMEWLAQLVEKQPDITLAELASRYESRTQTTVALSMMCRAMKKLGLVRKKR